MSPMHHTLSINRGPYAIELMGIVDLQTVLNIRRGTELMFNYNPNYYWCLGCRICSATWNDADRQQDGKMLI